MAGAVGAAQQRGRQVKPAAAGSRRWQVLQAGRCRQAEAGSKRRQQWWQAGAGEAGSIHGM